MKSILSTKKLSPVQKDQLLQQGVHVVDYDAIAVTFLDFDAPEIIDNAISGKLMEPKSTSHKIYCNKSKRWQPIMLLSSLFKIDVKSSLENL